MRRESTDVNMKSGMVFRPSVEPAGGRRETFQVPLLERGSSVPLPLAPNEIGVIEKMETNVEVRSPAEKSEVDVRARRCPSVACIFPDW